jgi:hypothetical protein
MFFFDHFNHDLGHAVKVPFGIPSPLFAGGGVVHFIGLSPVFVGKKIDEKTKTNCKRRNFGNK